jgi:hypothetical protein
MTSSFKSYVYHSHTIYSSGNIDVRNWVHFFNHPLCHDARSSECQIRQCIYVAVTCEIDDWSTVHRSITLVNFQLDAQRSYLFTYNTFIKILYMFRALLCSSSGGLRRNYIYAASGIFSLCRWLSCAPAKAELFVSQPVHRTVTRRDWRYQRLHIYNYDVDLLKMSRAMLETCRGF